MNKFVAFKIFFLISITFNYAQVGIGKADPIHILEINTKQNNLDGIVLDDISFNAQIFTNESQRSFILDNTLSSGTININFNSNNRFQFNNSALLPSVNASNNFVSGALDIGRFNRHFRRVYTQGVHTNDNTVDGGLGISIGSGGGTTSDYKFSDFAFYPIVSGTRDLGRNGNFWDNFYFVNAFTPSDRTLKTNIVDNAYGLETVLAIKTYNYTYKTDTKNKRHYGVMAQELQNILPELVTEKKKDTDKLAVNYIELIPVLIKSVQDQNEKIKELEAKVLSLQNDN